LTGCPSYARLVHMRRRSAPDIDTHAVNEALRALHGDTVTRQQVLDYRDKTGIDAKWIRRNEACRIGRGVYRIPGGASAPAGESVDFSQRTVMPTPFDDDATVISRPAKIAIDPMPAVEPEAPRFVHAWVCSDRECVGRKPGNFYPADGSMPVCECGKDMRRHSWSVRKSRI
jgi:hypothetical protein